MKYLATALLVISLVGISVFGFSLFTHTAMDGSSGNCVVSAIDGTKCPTNIMGMALHHIFAARIPMTIVTPPIFSLLLLLASLLFMGLAFFSPHFVRPPQLVFYKYRFGDSFSPPQKQQLTRWLALHENSPTIL
ncbi:MAG: hypothetical protein HYX23_00645 [Candidatus Zambryskibacteria bacterium]|nr:hypothetical protein [Candidatus Zambryskibacteria bacterium]